MALEIFNEMAQSILDGDSEKSHALAEMTLHQGIDPLQAIRDGFVKGIDVVGERYAAGEAFLPELVMAGEAMKSAIQVLEPEMMKRGTQRQILGTVVLATVQGDIHEIGKTLVGIMLSASGFQVFDLGVDASPEQIIGKSLEVNADIIAMSALLTTTMIKQRAVIDELEKEGLRARFKVIVGGSPVTREWVQQIRADGSAEDAVGAVALAKRLMEPA